MGASGDDGDVESGGATYPRRPAPRDVDTTAPRCSCAVRRRRSPYIPVTVGLLRFDTSSLPDNAVVSSAKLQLHATTKSSTNARSLAAEWYPASSWPIDGTDWSATDAATAHSGTPLSGITVGNTNEFVLQNLSSVSRTGFSALRLHVSGAATAPTGPNDLGFAAFDDPPCPSLDSS